MSANDMNRNIKVFINGRVFTANKSQPWAHAVVIEENKFSYVGSNEEALKIAEGKSVQATDVEGRLITPGLIDGHTHVFCDVISSVCSFSIGNDLKAAIASFVDENKDEDVVFGLDWDPLRPCWTKSIYSGEKLDKHFLDSICPDKPVLLLPANAHEGVCNSLALEMAHVDNRLPDFDVDRYDFFERDGFGEPTGYFCGRQSSSLIVSACNYFSSKKLLNCANDFFQNCFKFGITSVVDCGNFYFAKSLMNEHPAEFLSGKDEMPRLFACGFAAQQACLGAEGANFNYQRKYEDLNMSLSFDVAFKEANRLHEKRFSDRVTCNFMKILNDGTNENFADAPGVDYVVDFRPPDLGKRDLIVIGRSCAEAGIDLNVHATTSDAIHNILVATGILRSEGYSDLRVTTSHSTFVHPSDFELYERFGVVANSTGNFIPRMTKEHIEKAMQVSGAKSYPLRSITDAGGKIGLGSDCPCFSHNFNPFFDMEQAITRRAIDSADGYVNSPEEGITVADALQAYTINNAYQVHAEERIGSIEAGKLADMVIFDEDLFGVCAQDIHKIKAAETFIDGKCVYSNERLHF